MKSKEEIQKLRVSLFNQYTDFRIIEAQCSILDKIEKDLDKLNDITKILIDMIEEDKTGWLEMTHNYGKYLNKIEEWLENDK